MTDAAASSASGAASTDLLVANGTNVSEARNPQSSACRTHESTAPARSDGSATGSDTATPAAHNGLEDDTVHAVSHTDTAVAAALAADRQDGLAGEVPFGHVARVVVERVPTRCGDRVVMLGCAVSKMMPSPPV